MAVYAFGVEIVHDLHHTHFFHQAAQFMATLPDFVTHALGYLNTQHAVAFIALSHVSEHVKE
jgi:hypothetical protein